MEGSSVVRKKRSSNIELLRIVAMLSVVACHYVIFSNAPSLCSCDILDTKSWFLKLYGWGGGWSINAFILISGYFMSYNGITISRFVKFLMPIYFWGILFTLLDNGTGSDVLNVLINPIARCGRSFIASFLWLYILSPILNRIMESLSKVQFAALLVVLFSVLSVLSLIPIISLGPYPIIWFALVYMIGGWLRRYPADWMISMRKCLTIAILAFVACIASIIMMSLIEHWGVVHSAPGTFAYPWYFLNLTKPLSLFLSVSLFLVFLNLRIGYSRFVNMVAASTFGVFLIHGSPGIYDLLWNGVVDSKTVMRQGGGGVLIIHAVVSVLIVFTVCSMCEIVRLWLFDCLVSYYKHLRRKA